MRPLHLSRPRDDAKPICDFEWPPTADDLSVYEVGPDPWQKLQDASSQECAARHREPPQPPRQLSRQPTPEATQKLAGVLAASAIVAAAAGWVLYATTRRPVVVHTVHHPAPAAKATAAPRRITIVVTYPVEPEPSSAAPAGRDSAVAGDGTAASQPEDTGATPRVPVDPTPFVTQIGAIDPIAADPGPAIRATPVEAPAEATPAPAETVAPVAGSAAADPAGDTPAAGIRSLLRRYEEAYDRRDVRTAAALWPSLDQPALTRAFAGLDRQDVHFDRCEIDASEARGSAVCVGTVRYVPSIGHAVEKEDRITWTFDLARSGEDWRIAGLSAH